MQNNTFSLDGNAGSILKCTKNPINSLKVSSDDQGGQGGRITGVQICEGLL